MSRIAFAKLVMYTEEKRCSDGDKVAVVFKLSDLAQLYVSRREQLGIKPDTRVHTTVTSSIIVQILKPAAAKKLCR